MIQCLNKVNQRKILPAKYLWLSLLLAGILPFLARTQDVNAGGIGGGSAVSTSVLLMEDEIFAGIYTGGSGNGTNYAEGNIPLELAGLNVLFRGNHGRGDIMLYSFASLPNDAVAPLYKGGQGRGDSLYSSVVYLQVIQNQALYKGGKGKGDFALFRFDQLQDKTTSMLYRGGFGRGDVSEGKDLPLLSELFMLYSGGIGRGDTVLFFTADMFDVSNTRQIVVESAPIDALRNFDVKVLPNPTMDIFNVLVTPKTGDNIRIRVTDISGRVIEEKIISGEVRQVRLGDNWINGIYFMEIIQGSERKVVRMVKAR